MPEVNGHYGFSPAHECIVRWLKTPAGMIVRQAEYHCTAWHGKFLWWKFGHEAGTTTETETIDVPWMAIRRFMKDTDKSMNEAAAILELGDKW